jgi:hypothetical protein
VDGVYGDRDGRSGRDTVSEDDDMLNNSIRTFDSLVCTVLTDSLCLEGEGWHIREMVGFAVNEDHE